jgi:hypothetical protein
MDAWWLMDSGETGIKTKFVTLKLNKIYTSSYTTILYFINFGD